MTKRHLYLTALLAIGGCASGLHATILAYDGFATDASGTGSNYAEGALLESVNETRTGFQGSWLNGSNQNVNRNVRSELGNLTYANFVTGTEGLAVPFNNDSVQSTSTLERNLNITDGSVSGGYYVALLIDYSGSEGGFVFDGAAGGNSFVRSGSNVTWNPAGGSSTGGFTDTVTNLGISDSEANLIVVQYTTDQSDAPSNFYSQWNMWINPDLSGGSLGTVTATGMGIGLFDSGANVVAPTSFGISNARINNGSSSFVDEIYITNAVADFVVIPEQSTYTFACLAFVAALSMRRRR